MRGPSYVAQPDANGLFVQGGTLRVVQSSLHRDTNEHQHDGLRADGKRLYDELMARTRR